MPCIIAIGNLKGGVGKTTLVVNLACELALSHTVHMIDADPQATAFEWHQSADFPFSVDFRPAEKMDQMSEWVSHIRLNKADFVFIDLPPTSGAATAASAMIADIFLIPCTPSILDYRATRKALSAVRAARTARGNMRPRCLLVPCRVDRRLGVGRDTVARLHEMGELVGPSVGLRSAFINAATAKSWVGESAPNSIAHDEIKALSQAIKQLAST
jgi:chromosome partitioning protein